MLALLCITISAMEHRKHDSLLNVSNGTLITGIGGYGGKTKCDRVYNLDCSTLPRQMVGAVDFAMDEEGRYLFVATTGLDYIGECPITDQPSCRNASAVGVHDNSSRLLRFDLHTRTEPVTLSYCGPWKQVKYDTTRRQVIALRHTFTPNHPQGEETAEIVAFDADAAPAVDANSTSCANVVPIGGGGITCACASRNAPDPTNLNGKVIGRAGLRRDNILAAATMTLLDDRVLVGDQNDYCVVAFPLNGSAGKTTKGEPVAGTCGHSCGSQGCASIGSPPVKAGRKLGDGTYGRDLVYELFKSPDGRLLLHDMNTETIDYGKAPKAEKEYITVPIDPGVSSVFFKPLFEPTSGDLLVLETFTQDGYLLKKTKDGSGYGHGRKLVDHKKELSGMFAEWGAFGKETEAVTGIPTQWTFRNGKLLVLTSFALPTGSEYLDHAFVELEAR